VKILLTGRAGQIGWELEQVLPLLGNVVSTDRAALDLADADAVQKKLREVKPDIIVNAAAYTAVDKAESEPGIAMKVNGAAPGVMAEEAKRLGALLVHYSTDYVFDGTQGAPYVETDEPRPLGAYGRTKLAGERAIAASGCAHLILRTSWVYGPRGRNFLLTMLEAARTRAEVRVVDDQVGAPTSCLQLARATRALFTGRALRPIEAADVERAAARSGLYHATAAGAVSWHGFARAIFERRAALASTPFRAPRVVAIPTREYPTPTPRPANSRLDCEKLANAFGVRLETWQEGLEETLREIEGRK